MSSALRVLLIEDSEDDTDLLMLALARGKLKTEIHIVDTRPGMLDALQTQTWDIVLADYHLPQFSGPEALQVLQEQGLDIPFIIISGAMGEDVAVAMMKAGAHDYVLKSNLARLIPAIERELREANSRRAREIAERSLQATQRKYADLIHSIDGIVWEANAESLVITFVSEKLSRMLGYDRDSWQEHPSAWLDQIHPDDAERVVKAHRDALQHQPSYTLEYRRQHANGTYIWMRDTVSVAPDGGGRISLRGILMDITEAKHSADERERLLALAEERAEEILYLARQLQQIMDTTDQGIILLDPQCRLLLMNRAAQNILPLLISEDLSLDNPQERPIITQLSAQPMSELLARAIANNLPTEINLGAPHNRIFEITLHPVAAGITERGWLLSIVDVTQQRHLQAQVEQRNHLMAVGQLASGIAHDFNNILGVITLHLGLVQRSSALTDKDRERLNLIERQTDHAAHLIHQILDFSRRSVMELQEVELVEFFHEFMGILESTITSDVRIELAHGMKRHSVQADRTRLQQLFLNLIVNARDAMQEGGRIDIRIAAMTLDDPEAAPQKGMELGEWVYIQVADNGKGMEPSILPNIFQPFFTTKGPGEGTGLGLAQVYGIIRQHGGHVTVESILGQGTTFTVYLPRIQSTRPKDAMPAQTISDEGLTGRILVVDDNEGNLHAVVDGLQTYGYTVLSANDGNSAIKILADNSPEIDLVVCDLVMGKVNGQDVYRVLVTRDIPLIVMTGYPLLDEGRELLESGAVDWIRKPFALESLIDKIRKALALHLNDTEHQNS